MITVQDAKIATIQAKGRYKEMFEGLHANVVEMVDSLIKEACNNRKYSAKIPIVGMKADTLIEYLQILGYKTFHGANDHIWISWNSEETPLEDCIVGIVEDVLNGKNIR